MSEQYCLCPSGTGPNSIRLWEAIAFKSIPVILSDNLALPGRRQLWDSAAVTVPECEDAISGIPALLKQREDGVEDSLKSIDELFGQEVFIADILA